MREADDLGPLPETKGYRINGPAKFTLRPVVRVDLQCTRDTPDLLSAFLRWMLLERVYPATSGGSSGGREYHGLYSAKDAVRIKAWLVEHGAVEGSYP